MRGSAIIGLVALAVAATACQPPESPDEVIARLTPEQKANVRRTIAVWLECEECANGELEAVVGVGVAAIPTLSAVLQEGPSPASLESVRRSLESSYRELAEYAASHPEVEVPMAENEYIETFLDNYVALHRVRAATALGAIGGPFAEEALQGAPPNLREDVAGAVRAALDSVG